MITYNDVLDADKMKSQYKEFYEDLERSRYWVTKQSNGKHFNEMMNEYFARHLHYPAMGEVVEIIDYKGRYGNRWRNYVRFAGAEPLYGNKVMLQSQTESICFWETLGSFGAFDSQRTTFGNMMCVYSPHFFQRYCERTGEKMMGVNTAQEFFMKVKKYYFMFLPEYDKNDIATGKMELSLIFAGFGVGYGKALSTEIPVMELRTFLPLNMLTGRRAALYYMIMKHKQGTVVPKKYERAVRELEDEVEKAGGIMDTPLEERNLV